MSSKQRYELGSFSDEVEKLQKIEGLVVLQNDQSMIAVSGVYQGRIFTSSSKGMEGRSYGWINWDLIEQDKHATTIANLGGESRLWFAPEWGANALFFAKGVQQEDANRRLPFDMDNKKFKVSNQTATTLTAEGTMQIKNNNDFVFDMAVERKISLLSKTEIAQNLSIQLPNDLACVGFSAESTIQNIGEVPFQKETGLIGIWELGCMLTAPDNWVILPLSQATDSITEYFTPIGDRMQIKGEVVYYKADALGINKIGILPQFCKNVMGSYSPSQNLLNIVTFTFEKEGVFVNSLPHNTTPYQGDVINIFNGEVNDELNVPFYEFESNASAKELQPTEKMHHRQTTYHFEGTMEALDVIAVKVLGVSLKDIP